MPGDEACLPPVLQVCGAAHSGWAGTLAQISKNVVAVMTHRFHCDPSCIRAVIGPSIGPCHYEVGDDLADRFANEISPNVVVRKKSAPRPFLDLRSCVRMQLEGAGLNPQNIDDGTRYKVERGGGGARAALQITDGHAAKIAVIPKAISMLWLGPQGRIRPMCVRLLPSVL